MSVLEWKKDGNVAIITMTNGENRHNLVFFNALLQALAEIEADAAATSVVIASNDEKNWSQGIDLTWMMSRMQEKDLKSIREFLYLMNDTFKRLLLYPMPVIAAISGHAVANGAILACACDFRFMTGDRGFFFFPEIDIGIPLLPGMAAFIPKAIPYYKFNEMILSGTRYFAPEMAEHHVIQKACDSKEALMADVMVFAQSFAKKRGIFGEMKTRLHRRLVDIIDTEDPPIIEPLNIMVQD